LAARDPASDALSPPRSRRRGWLDRGRYRALFTPGRSWPRAARRLLQSKRSASTTSRPRNPMRMEAARLSPSSSPAAPVRTSMGPRRFPDTIPPRRSRGLTGQGPLNRDTLLSKGLTGLPRRDGSLRRLRPNPIGSNTSCRATRVDYDRSTVIELPDAPASHSNEFESSPPGTRLREGFRGGPPPAPLREKEMRSAAPEVLSVARPPLRGVPFSTACTQPVDGRTRAFSIFAPDRARTVRRGRRGLDLSSKGGFPLFEEDPPRRAR
jgi:hypothetical protein